VPKTWVEVGETEEAIAGQTYRLTLVTRTVFSQAIAWTIAQAIRFGYGVRNVLPWSRIEEKVEILTVYWGDPDTYAQRDGGRNGEWPLFIEMRKTSEGTALAVIYGLIALVLVSSFAILLTGRKWERLTEAVGEETRQVLNPGLVLGAFIVGALALKRR